MNKIYHYIGPDDLRGFGTERQNVQQPRDVLNWISRTRQRLEGGDVVATFVIDIGGQLWVADRRSEHVACASGQAVLSAGEMTFHVEDRRVSVEGVSNQSLGYCPEPESWPAVAAALGQAGLPHPSCFTSAYIIRRCEACGAKNIVKDGVYECGVCGGSLPVAWNLERLSRAV